MVADGPTGLETVAQARSDEEVPTAGAPTTRTRLVAAVPARDRMALRSARIRLVLAVLLKHRRPRGRFRRSRRQARPNRPPGVIRQLEHSRRQERTERRRQIGSQLRARDQQNNDADVSSNGGGEVTMHMVVRVVDRSEPLRVVLDHRGPITATTTSARLTSETITMLSGGNKSRRSERRRRA
jgi:hypothetical protein